MENIICSHGTSADQVTTPSNLAKQGSGDGITGIDAAELTHRNEDWQVGSGCNTADTSAVLKSPTEGVQMDERTAPQVDPRLGFPKGSPFGGSVSQTPSEEVSGND